MLNQRGSESCLSFRMEIVLINKTDRILDLRAYKVLVIQNERLKEAFIILSQEEDKAAAYAVKKVIEKQSQRIAEYEGRYK